ncbi:hypothetical protein Saro_0661 [Novosphingobium aromaticivorans DSM 12444]|uniref:Uncharacterized protein n=1 Tax=Novosphingobium aromaticivorans (strain ATCC 700278 / DSM 12444 / CCUG 56034 / CIP 105152 / NBRC 16084 / F199) TaxID=279238 RepID=Q2GAL5_NOVAD|nr:hypothetical protein [Novosphingobium aromaticivorans]ABD25108.1 hypothetical protein Saro_0661 [Novosphingobium aromaticivorans DSM 12444]SCY95741.1 hypothetical protein SAMN05660666_03875 [Novosphingobium aromaticivorans]
MRIVRPISVTNTNLLSSNVPETPPAAYDAGATYALDALVSVLTGTVAIVYRSLQAGNTGNTPGSSPDWWLALGTAYLAYDSGTTYALDDIVFSAATNHTYQSLQAANTGHALDDPSWWLDLGPTNRYRMFDQANSSQTTNAESIIVEVQVTGRADAVSLLNIAGASAQVVAETVEDGEIYNETFNLVSPSGINDWYQYFFEPIVRQGDLTVYDLPLNANPVITVTLIEPGATAKIGSLVIGQSQFLGDTIHPAKLGIQDFSRKETDEFGNFTIIERSFARRATFKVAIDEARMDAISTALTNYRAEAIVWLGVDSYASSWIYGFYRDWEFDLSAPEETYLNIELEGLT